MTLLETLAVIMLGIIALRAILEVIDPGRRPVGLLAAAVLDSITALISAAVGSWVLMLVLIAIVGSVLVYVRRNLRYLQHVTSPAHGMVRDPGHRDWDDDDIDDTDDDDWGEEDEDGQALYRRLLDPDDLEPIAHPSWPRYELARDDDGHRHG